MRNREVQRESSYLMQIRKRGDLVINESCTMNSKHTPGSLFLQLLSRFGSLVDDLLAVGVFYLAFI